MAKTKAKAKVKTVVKNKAKAAPKKAAPAKKSVAPKKAAAPKSKSIASAKKKAPLKKEAPSKKTIPTKAAANKAKKAAPAKTVAKKMQPLKKVEPVKKPSPAKKAAAPAKKVAAPEVKKKVDKKEKVSTKKALTEKPVAKKASSPEKDESAKKAKFEFPKKRAGRKPKNKGDEDDGFELLEVPKLEPIRKNPPKKKFIIPVNPEVYVNPLVKPVVVPKNMGNYKKFEIEFPIHASPYIIYSFISTPAGLSEWFAENVNVRNDEYTFLWDGSQQTATLLSKKENTFMKFRWNDEPEFTYFEFRIVVDEITQDVAFWVTDFAEDEKSKEASEMLWHSQIEALIHAMGA